MRKTKATQKILEKVVKASGTQAMKGTKDCQDWLRLHNSCTGCPYQLGCEKMAAIDHLILYSILALDEFCIVLKQKLEQERDNAVSRILSAKTVEEVKNEERRSSKKKFEIGEL